MVCVIYIYVDYIEIYIYAKYTDMCVYVHVNPRAFGCFEPFGLGFRSKPCLHIRFQIWPGLSKPCLHIRFQMPKAYLSKGALPGLLTGKGSASYRSKHPIPHTCLSGHKVLGLSQIIGSGQNFQILPVLRFSPLHGAATQQGAELSCEVLHPACQPSVIS